MGLLRVVASGVYEGESVPGCLTESIMNLWSDRGAWRSGYGIGTSAIACIRDNRRSRLACNDRGPMINLVRGIRGFAGRVPAGNSLLPHRWRRDDRK